MTTTPDREDLAEVLAEVRRIEVQSNRLVRSVMAGGYASVFRGAGPDTRKLSAAWLIEACGWKGHRDGDAGVSAAHALVLVNHGQATGAQLLALARRIAESVHARFGVAIEPEPKIIGARW